MSVLSRPMTFEEVQEHVRIDLALTEALAQVSQLDFTMLKIKLIEEKLWSQEYCNEIEDLYRKFLALNVRYPEKKICPSGPIDDFWHAHILDTRAYAKDCQTIFGYFLHHYPYFGMRGAEDKKDLEAAFLESIELFIIHYGIDPTAGDTDARKCRPQKCP